MLKSYSSLIAVLHLSCFGHIPFNLLDIPCISNAVSHVITNDELSGYVYKFYRGSEHWKDSSDVFINRNVFLRHVLNEDYLRG